MRTNLRLNIFSPFLAAVLILVSFVQSASGSGDPARPDLHTGRPQEIRSEVQGTAGPSATLIVKAQFSSSTAATFVTLPPAPSLSARRFAEPQELPLAKFRGLCTQYYSSDL